MAVTRREMLNQLQSMIDAERKVMAATGSISIEEIDSAGFIDEAEEGEPSLPSQLFPSDSPSVTSSPPFL